MRVGKLDPAICTHTARYHRPKFTSPLCGDGRRFDIQTAFANAARPRTGSDLSTASGIVTPMRGNRQAGSVSASRRRIEPIRCKAARQSQLEIIPLFYKRKGNGETLISCVNRTDRYDSGKSLDAVSKGSETPGMSSDADRPIHLRRIDPTQNMRRFYSLAIQPTLFGGASVIRNWGRIGTNGQSMMETFDQAEEAKIAMAKLQRTKQRRGYSV